MTKNSKLPKHEQRIFRTFDVDDLKENYFYNVFSPEIRDNFMFNGFNRSYMQVTAIQRNLEKVLNDLVYAIDVYATLGGLAPFSQSKLTCTWGDSVLEDTEKEFQRRLQMVTTGLISKEKFITWYFGCDESKASEYLPQFDNLFGGK